jgi:hypothetical protein
MKGKDKMERPRKMMLQNHPPKEVKVQSGMKRKPFEYLFSLNFSKIVRRLFLSHF